MTGIITNADELRQLLRDELSRELATALENHASKPNPAKLFTRAQVARFLGKSKATIQLMIDRERIQATADGKYISQQAINNYLTGKSPNRPTNPTI